CHEKKPCKVQDAKSNCIACHMPKANVRDTEHAVFTDHTIPRREGQKPADAAGDRRLEPFWRVAVDDRDVALANAAVGGADAPLLIAALRKAQTRDPGDVLVLSQLAQLVDQAGDEGQAMALSQQVVRLDPSQVAVAVNL